MNGVQNNPNVNKQFEIYANRDRAARLQRAAENVYRMYRLDTPLLSRILAHFRPDFHSTVKWICTCLQFVDEFRNTELLNEVAKECRSLRLALREIDKMEGSDLKTRAIRFAAEKAKPGCNVVECRYEPRTGNFFAELTLDENHSVDLGSGKHTTWDALFLASGLRPYKAFYDHLATLARLHNLHAPEPPNYATETLNNCLKAADPLKAVDPELEYNQAVTLYNEAIVENQNAIFNALGDLETDPRTKMLKHPWLTYGSATRLLDSHILKIMVMDGMRLKDEVSFNDAIKGVNAIYAKPVKYSDELYSYTTAGLDVPLPDDQILEKLRKHTQEPDKSLPVSNREFASTYGIARGAVEHYGKQIKHVNTMLAKTTKANDALNSRLALINTYYNRALHILQSLRLTLQLPVNKNDNLSLSEIEQRYATICNGSQKVVEAPKLSDEDITVTVPDLLGRKKETVGVKQSVRGIAQWMAEAKYTPTPVKGRDVSQSWGRELPIRQGAAPEPSGQRHYKLCDQEADGAAILNEIKSLYAATGYSTAIPEKALSMPAKTSSLETTLLPRVTSF